MQYKVLKPTPSFYPNLTWNCNLLLFLNGVDKTIDDNACYSISMSIPLSELDGMTKTQKYTYADNKGAELFNSEEIQLICRGIEENQDLVVE